MNGLKELPTNVRKRLFETTARMVEDHYNPGGEPDVIPWAPYTGLNIRSTSIIDISYVYFGLVLGCIDADLCK